MVKGCIFLAGLGLIFVIIDQILKFLAQRFFQGGIFVFGKFFNLVFFRNYGVAFGLKIPPFLFYLLVILIIYFIFRKFQAEITRRNFYILLSLFFILSGAASNLCDRILRGYVIDYFYLYPMSYFNLADLGILAGVIMIGWKEIKINQQSTNNK